LITWLREGARVSVLPGSPNSADSLEQDVGDLGGVEGAEEAGDVGKGGVDRSKDGDATDGLKHLESTRSIGVQGAGKLSQVGGGGGLVEGARDAVVAAKVRVLLLF
jgi:hypothetical protein